METNLVGARIKILSSGKRMLTGIVRAITWGSTNEASTDFYLLCSLSDGSFLTIPSRSIDGKAYKLLKA